MQVDQAPKETSTEEMLVMKERLVLSQQEANGLRLLLQRKIDQVSKLELELIDKKLELEKVQA